MTALAINVEIKNSYPNEEVYYEYHPARLHWHAVNQLCSQRSGSLALIPSAGEKQNLTNFLQSLNISEPVWIARRAPEINGDLQITHFLIFYIMCVYQSACNVTNVIRPKVMTVILFWLLAFYLILELIWKYFCKLYFIINQVEHALVYVYSSKE